MKSAIIEAAEELERQAELVMNNFNLSNHDASAWHGSGRNKLFRWLQDLAQRLRAEAERPSIPEGWKLVPVEPTHAMTLAGKYTIKGAEDGEFESIIAEAVYRNMLNAAPTPPAVKDSLTTDPRWKDAPNWANFLAMDGSGKWYWFSHNPYVPYFEGLQRTGSKCADAGPPLNWKEMLQQRPVSHTEGHQ